MNVEIIFFPLTFVAAVEHIGHPELEHETVKKLITWKLEHQFTDPLTYKNFGIHYTDPNNTPSLQHRVDFCISFDREIQKNPYGVMRKVIPACRCARARDIGSRYNNKAAFFLQKTWLPKSGEIQGDFPMFFHYVNVGPNIQEIDMITDVYLPLKF